MLNIKTKLISAVMGISMIGSTGLASVVHASPVNVGNANAKPGVVCKTSHSHKVAPAPVKHIAPKPAKKVAPVKAAKPAPAKNVAPAKTAKPAPTQLPVNIAK